MIEFVNGSGVMTLESKVPIPNFKIESNEGSMVFQVKGSELFRIESGGEVFVRGSLTTVDMEVYEAFKAWISQAVAQPAPQ